MRDWFICAPDLTTVLKPFPSLDQFDPFTINLTHPQTEDLKMRWQRIRYPNIFDKVFDTLEVYLRFVPLCHLFNVMAK
ncbi:hypothetical protein RclHR1_04140002 [Rhizophagus clarus]|uniref:Uncharacterized protein n=1 Tax=Rhizophagus clarus TaxID=94130 RepID=A0A2Z6S9P2_9GLOM|nr:hypothetical protein RclHR1_04140002 [Rhizophagus clarus]